MGDFMHKMSFHGTQVLFPLLLNMDQCPLPAAKHEMLYT
jgi:hypothetical protein